MEHSNKLTLIEALNKLKDGEITSVDLVKDCFEQIETYDAKIQAFVSTRKADALEEAKKADKLIREQGNKVFTDQPLLGIPYACKDNFSTKDIETTASSNVLKGYIPPYESTVTQRLKDAGAIVLGKTNMDAFAHGASTETSDFFTTKNPWDLTKVSGGSSGGSAAALISNMCIFALGSETAASIRGPSAWCGVTGIKPTYGRVSRYGVIAMCSSTDSPGPITKTAEDSALLLKVIAGKDKHDATSSNEEVPDYLNELNDVDLTGLRIGKPKSYFDAVVDKRMLKPVEEALKKFKSLGAEIVEVDLIDPKYSIGVYTIVQRSEVSSNLARFDGIRYGHFRSSFGHEARKRMMLGAYALSAGYYDQYYSKAQKVRTLIIEDFKKAYEKVDVLLGPTMPIVAPELGINESSPLFGELIDQLQEPSAVAGLTGISFPVGEFENLPVGAQFIGHFFSEDLLLKLVHKFQQETDHHTKFPDLKEIK